MDLLGLGVEGEASGWRRRVSDVSKALTGGEKNQRRRLGHQSVFEEAGMPLHVRAMLLTVYIHPYTPNKRTPAVHPSSIKRYSLPA